MSLVRWAEYIGHCALLVSILWKWLDARLPRIIYSFSFSPLIYRIWKTCITINSELRIDKHHNHYIFAIITLPNLTLNQCRASWRWSTVWNAPRLCFNYNQQQQHTAGPKTECNILETEDTHRNSVSEIIASASRTHWSITGFPSSSL